MRPTNTDIAAALGPVACSGAARPNGAARAVNPARAWSRGIAHGTTPEPAPTAADRNARSGASTAIPGDTGAAPGGGGGRHAILSALVTAAAVSVAAAQTPPARQADQPQPRFHPVTCGTDPVGVIHASPAPGGRLPVFGATARPDGNTAQGGVYVPHGCPRAVTEGATRR